MEKQPKYQIAVLSLSNYITVLVNTVLFPVFPLIAKALDLTLKDLAVMVGIVSFPSATINLFSGLIADRLGRKKVIVISLFIYGLGGLVAGLSAIFLKGDAYPYILVGRLLQGIGSSTPMYLTVALVGDLFDGPQRTKNLGFLETASSMGKVSSPIIGAIVGLISWYAVFFIYPILAFPIAVITWFYIKEPVEAGNVSWAEQKKALGIFKKFSRLLSIMAAFLIIFCTIGTGFWLSDYLESTLKMNQVLRGVIIATPAITMMLTTLFAGKFCKSINPRYLMGFGLIFMASGMALIVLTTKTIFFWFVIGLIGIGAGFAMPIVDTVSTSVKDETIRGQVATIYGSSRTLGGAFAPMVFSFLLKKSLALTFYSTAVFTIVIGLSILFFLREKEILPADFVNSEGKEN
ncbi:MAG TPA: MFS transporter [Syntrophomonadaceae bacterium]|nr:MFS transporter [Syntrophomonadaceae bacterium]